MSNNLRIHLSVLACLLGSFSPLFAARAEPLAAAEQEIARLENLYSQSFVTGDASVADRLLADDFIGFEPNGKPSDKAAVLAEVKREPHLMSAKITALRVRLHGDTVIALGTEEDTNPGSATVSRRRWLDTWKIMPDGWHMVASAEIAPAP